MKKVTVNVRNWEVRVVQSPVYWFVAGATGLVGSLAPLFLYFLGKADTPITSPYVLGLLSLIYFVYLFYVFFGVKVIGALRKQDTLFSTEI